MSKPICVRLPNILLDYSMFVLENACVFCFSLSDMGLYSILESRNEFKLDRTLNQQELMLPLTLGAFNHTKCDCNCHFIVRRMKISDIV